jgi:hypothetical protein
MYFPAQKIENIKAFRLVKNISIPKTKNQRKKVHQTFNILFTLSFRLQPFVEYICLKINGNEKNFTSLFFCSSIIHS